MLFYEMYKKQVWISGFVVLLIILVGIVFLFRNQDSKIVKNIDVKMSSGSVKFNDSEITKQKYDYYQVYLYPETFDITCSSDKKELCENIKKNKNTFKTNIIGFFGRDLTKGNSQEVEIKTYFDGSDVDSEMVKNIFVQMQIRGLDFTKKTRDNDILKYFEYKKENNPDMEITLNDMEIACFENIKNSILVGSFEEENIIKDRVKDECVFFADMSPIDVAFAGISNIDDTEITIGVSIKELKVLYKFFKKEGLEFKEKTNEQKIIKTDIKTSSTFKLSEVLSF